MGMNRTIASNKVEAEIKVAVRVSHTPLLQQTAAKFNECKNNAATPSVKHILLISLTIEIKNHTASSP